MEKIKLLCLPFAGGSKYSYAGFAKYAPKHIEVIPIEIPGRGGRIREKLLTDIHKIVEDIYHQVKSHLDEPYAIYGHSMGTILAYLLTKKIEASQLNMPRYLFVTGRKGPSLDSNTTRNYLLPKQDFFNKLKELGGSPEEILKDRELMDFFEPIIRADFQAVETYQYEASTPLDIPIYVMYGSEEKTTLEEAQAWQEVTTEKVMVREFPGKYFFIFNYQKEIMEIIGRNLNHQTVRL